MYAKLARACDRLSFLMLAEAYMKSREIKTRTTTLVSFMIKNNYKYMPHKMHNEYSFKCKFSKAKLFNSTF